MTQPHPQPNPNELLSITREELERCCSQMSAAGYKVSANYVEAMVLSRSRPHTPAAPATPNNFPTVNRREDGELTLVYDYGSLIEHDAAIRKAEREQVLDVLEEFLNSDDHLSLFKWEVREQIRSLRGGGAP
jgi:hypothetical protein